MSYAAKEWFQKLGSKQIWDLKYRQGYALIAVSGNTDEIYEKRALDKNDYVHLSQIMHGLEETDDFNLDIQKNEFIKNYKIQIKDLQALKEKERLKNMDFDAYKEKMN